MTGKLIVIEGADGSGKKTQADYLKKYLESQKIKHQVTSFPRYGQNPYANLVKDYLNGKFGKVSQIDPHLISLTYAGDRMLAAPMIREWLEGGNIVIADRYLHSNVAYTLARLSENEHQEFINWSYDLEYATNGLPKEEIVILLNIDPKVANQNIKSRNKDLHEKDLSYQQEVVKAYLKLAKLNSNWVVIESSDNGKMRPAEEINNEIIQILVKENILS